MPSISRPLDRRAGSAQVVEFSWVFPFAALVVVALMYLSFLLFFYVYGFHLVELTADEALHETQSSQAVAGTEVPGAEEELNEKVRKLSFLPGVRLAPEVRTGTFGKKITVTLDCIYWGKPMFCVKAERKVLNPVEYARQTDLAQFLKRM